MSWSLFSANAIANTTTTCKDTSTDICELKKDVPAPYTGILWPRLEAVDAALCPQVQKKACDLKIRRLNKEWLAELSQEKQLHKTDMARVLKIVDALERELEVRESVPWYQRPDVLVGSGFIAGATAAILIFNAVK